MAAIVFIEASLELVPKSIASHPAVLADARRRKKRPTEMLLDDSKHHSAMRGLPMREKRGRPDIVHQCLLLTLDSPRSSELEVYIHTIGGEIIRVSSDVRLPRTYTRFVGLIEDLFAKRRIVADGKILLEIIDAGLEDVLDGRDVVVLHERGSRVELESVLHEDAAVCIGAFPHGDFSDDTLRILRNAKFVSVGEGSYTSLYVTCRVIAAYERVRAT